MKKVITITTALATLALNANAQIANSMQTSKAAMNKVSEVSSDSSQMINDSIIQPTIKFSGTVSAKTQEALLSFADGAKDITVKGYSISQQGATLVVENAKSSAQKVSDLSATASEAAKKGSQVVVTTSGQIIEASIDKAGTAIKASVEVSQNALETSNEVAIIVYNESKTAVIGSATVSKNIALDMKDLSVRASESTEEAIEFSINKTGTLLMTSKNMSAKALGTVVDASGKVVTFVSDKSEKIYTSSKENSIMIIQNGSQAFKTFAASVVNSQVMKFSVNEVKASAAGSLVVLKASGKAIMMVVRPIQNLIFSEKQ